MSRSLSGVASSGSVPFHSVAASRIYSRLHGLELGRRLHLEQRRFLQPAAADHVEIREMREAS